MKIARHLRQDTSWPYEVTGPGVEGKKFPSEGAAIGFAQMYAAKIQGTYYVRIEGETLCWSEPYEGTIVTRWTRAA